MRPETIASRSVATTRSFLESVSIRLKMGSFTPRPATVSASLAHVARRSPLLGRRRQPFDPGPAEPSLAHVGHGLPGAERAELLRRAPELVTLRRALERELELVLAEEER